MSLSSIGDMADSLSTAMTASRATAVRQLPSGGPQLSQRTAFNLPGMPPMGQAAAASARMAGDDSMVGNIRGHAFAGNQTSLAPSGAFPTTLSTAGRGASTQMDTTGGVGQLRGQTRLYDPPDTSAGGTQGSAGKSQTGMEGGGENLSDVMKELIKAIEANTEAQGGGGGMNMGDKPGKSSNGKQSGQDMEGLMGVAVSQFYKHLK